jgi:hypothetical protein
VRYPSFFLRLTFPRRNDPDQLSKAERLATLTAMPLKSMLENVSADVRYVRFMPQVAVRPA